MLPDVALLMYCLDILDTNPGSSPLLAEQPRITLSSRFHKKILELSLSLRSVCLYEPN